MKMNGNDTEHRAWRPLVAQSLATSGCQENAEIFPHFSLSGLRFSSVFSVSIWIIIIILGTLLLARSAGAHGDGTLKVANEPIGDYQVSVWTAPAVPRGGDPLHVTVGVARSDDGRPVLDTAVQVEAFTADGSQLLGSAAATTEQSVNKLFYEADLPAFDVGTVKIAVTVTGKDGEGAVTFDQEIRPYFNTTLIIGLLVGGALLTGIAWVWSWKKQQAGQGNGRIARPLRQY